MRREPNPNKEMPFTHHLEELRWHILRSIFYLMAMCGIAWNQYPFFFGLFNTPLQRAFKGANVPANLTFLHFLDPLFFKCQIVLTVAVILSLPLILWEVWRFIAPGLYENERRNIAPLLPFSIGLSFAGVAMIYYAVPIAIQFLLQFLPKDGQFGLIQDPQRYFYFLMRMMVGAALAFQTPVVLLILGQLELVTSRGLMRFWRHAILINFTVAAIVTPTIDPFNMTVMALPLCGLYFLSVVLVWFVERKRLRLARRNPPDETPLPTPPSAPSDPPLLTAAEPEPVAAAPEPVTAVAGPQPPAEAADDEPALPVAVGRGLMGPLAVPQFDDPAEQPEPPPAPPAPSQPNWRLTQWPGA